MMQRRHRPVVIVAFAALVAAGLGATGHDAGAAPTQVLGDWRMDEAKGATRLVDSSGNGYHGTIGNKVVLGVRSGGATVHEFPYISSTAPPDAGRLHIVNQPQTLNPGTGDFAVEVRFNTYSIHSNITQKGQSGATGGYWKVEVDDGVAACVFRGSSASVGLKSTKRVTDKVWHTVRCERRAAESVMILDGVQVARARVSTGNISNTWTLAIGGKSKCDSVKVQCDYFRGSIDYVRIERPGTTTTAAAAAAPLTSAAGTPTTSTPPATRTAPPVTAPPTTTVPVAPSAPSTTAPVATAPATVPPASQPVVPSTVVPSTGSPAPAAPPARSSP